MVRVDFFKPSGKWYATEAVKWLDYDGDPYEVFRRSLLETLRIPEKLNAGTDLRYRGMIAVCIEPNAKHSFPLITVVGAPGPIHFARHLYDLVVAEDVVTHEKRRHAKGKGTAAR